MSLMQRIWNNFKTQPDSWFFYGFLLTFTLSIRKVLFFYPIASQFNEYSGIYLYLSDIFLFLTFLTWIISSSYHKYSIMSILKNSNVPSREKCSTWNIFRDKRGTFLLPLLFVIWSFISIYWSTNPSIAFFRSLKLLEFYFLFLYIVIQIVPRGTIFQDLIKIIIGTGLIQSIIGIWQFAIQHSIGLFWLKESLISPNILGVAKVIFSDTKIIRSYGLFPHPNVLGGFLLLSIILTLAYKKLFHVEQFKNNQDTNCSTPACPVGRWNNSHCEIYKPSTNVPRGTFSNKIHQVYYYFILLIQAIAIFLTFSKSAIIGLIIGLLFIYSTTIVPRGTKLSVLKVWINRLARSFRSKDNVPRGTLLDKKSNQLFHVEHLSRKLFLILGIILVLGVITKTDINSLFIKSLDERLLYLNVSYETIANNSILGIGSGQFVLNIQNNVPRPPRVDEWSSPRVEAGGTFLEAWQFQPVHNVFLLIWSELGLIGIILFLYFLYKLFHVEQFENMLDIKCSTWNKNQCEVYEPTKNVPRGTFLNNINPATVFKGILLGFLFIMLFDHYLWDIQQGQILLWLVFGLLAGSNRQHIDK